MTSLFTSRKLILSVTAVGVIAAWFFALPEPLFQNPFATVLLDRNGSLLSASIAADGQWRFPEIDEVNTRFGQAITAYEDKRFWTHPGVDVRALARACRENLRAGRIISGGSTLTMQVIRLSRQNPPRTFVQKIIEIVLAARLEMHYSKNKILGLYASHAPFGGNVVGVEAASWRYFGRSSNDLSWGEAALLAVLPNNPSLLHLSRNRQRLQHKRDLLLKKLMQNGALDEMGYRLAIAEPIPDSPTPLPRLAVHLLDRVMQEGHGQRLVKSSIDTWLQERVAVTAEQHQQRLRGNQIFNGAALVLDVKSGQVLAYVGNTRSGREHEESVDIIRSPRSTGSILKPFLFAALLKEGAMLPGTLISDVPTLINGFAPRNFSKQFDGAVAADQALIRSLNVPAVVELRDYRYEKFYGLLRNLGMSTLSNPADHYGLSLVLGGGEGTLWDLTGMYASAARVLTGYFERAGKNRYDASDIHPPVYLASAPRTTPRPEMTSHLDAASLWITFETLREMFRPGEESGWQQFRSARPIAWKTGTSFGLRDGWAIGVNPDYAVGVWVGNADGEGRPGLTGTEVAAPLLFDIFSLLPGKSWFQKPNSELVEIPICAQSGQRPSALCHNVDTIAVPAAGLATPVCPYHKLIHLSPDGRYRLHGDCSSLDQVQPVSWFVLPPVQEYYYKSRNQLYKALPPYRADCADPVSLVSMDLIYPKVNARIFRPVQLNGQSGSVVFEATHRNSSTVVYWHLDGHFIGLTRKLHQVAVTPDTGSHVLTLVDDGGQILERPFFIISPR